MKKMISILLALVLTLAFLPLEVFADDVEDTVTSGVTGSCVWSLDGTVLTISGNGDGVMADYYTTSSNTTTNTPWGNAITQVVIEDGVSVIGNCAFYYCLNLTQVTIPDSVTTIKRYAFGECRNLSSVELPSRLITIGNYAFYSCKSLASLALPETVSTLGNCAFAYCDKLSAITIPGSVAEMGSGVFSHCIRLSSVTVAEGCTTLGSGTFSSCDSLVTVDLANSITSIGSRAFANCTKLATIELPPLLSEIPEHLFFYCYNLSTVNLPQGITAIGESAFWGCEKLTDIQIPARVTTIGTMAFAYCNGLTTVSIPHGVTTLGRSAFIGCDNLTTATLPASITTIGPCVFSLCENLEAILYLGTWEQFLRIDADDDNDVLNNMIFMAKMETIVIATSGKTGMDLVWTNNPGADGFYVYRRDYKQGAWSDWVTIATLPKNTIDYTDTNVANGEKYIYTVQAYKGDSITPILATDPCYYLTPTILKQTNTAAGVQLSWNKNTAAQGYVIYRYIWDDRQNNWVDESLVARTTDTSYVDKNVVHGKYYAYDVHAYIGESYSFVDYADKYGYIRYLQAPRVTASNDGNGIKITWNDRTATYYNVDRRTYENGVWSEWNLCASRCSGGYYTDRSAKAGKIYQYAVQGVYKTYEDTFASADSITASVRRLIAPTLTIANAAKGIQLSWDKVAGADQYDIYRQLADGNWSKIKTTATIGYIDTTAEGGISYTYRVRAVQGDSASVDSAPVSILHLTTPTVTIANVTKGIQLSWDNVTGADKYDIYRQLSSGEWSKIKTTTVTSYTDTDAKAGKSYTYQVRALQGDLVSADGTTASIRRLTAPTVTATNATKGIRLSWDKVTGASKYYVYRRLDSGNWSKIKTTTATDFTDTDAKAGKSYTYRVRAVQGDSASVDSAPVSILRLTTPTVKTSNVTKGIQLSWNKVTGASKYYVYRRLDSGNWSKIKTTTATSYTDTGAKAGKSYTYRVRAVKGDAISAYKTTTSIRRLKTSASLKLAKATKGFKVTWSKVTGAKKYEIYRRTGNGNWVKIKTTTARSYTDKTAKKGRFYTYRVRAVSGSSKSAYKSSSKTKR